MEPTTPDSGPSAASLFAPPERVDVVGELAAVAPLVGAAVVWAAVVVVAVAGVVDALPPDADEPLPDGAEPEVTYDSHCQRLRAMTIVRKAVTIPW